MAGALGGGVIVASLSHPMDTIKTCQQGDVTQKTYRGVVHAGVEIAGTNVASMARRPTLISHEVHAARARLRFWPRLGLADGPDGLPVLPLRRLQEPPLARILPAPLPRLERELVVARI